MGKNVQIFWAGLRPAQKKPVELVEPKTSGISNICEKPVELIPLVPLVLGE